MGDAVLLLSTSVSSRALKASDIDLPFQGETSLSQSQHRIPSPEPLPVPGCQVPQAVVLTTDEKRRNG